MSHVEASHDEFLARRHFEKRARVEPTMLPKLTSSLDDPPRTTSTDLETNLVPAQLSNLDVFVRRSAVETEALNDSADLDVFVRRSAVETEALNDSADLDVFVRMSECEMPTQEIEAGVDFQRLCSFERINYLPDPNRMLRKTPPPPIERED
jgi:cold shock CspA family protein